MEECKKDEKNDPNEKALKLSFYGVRHTLAVLCAIGYAHLLAMRVCLSVVIVAMVKSAHNETSNPGSDAGECSYALEYRNISLNNDNSGELEWDEETKGKALGAFFIGYTLTNSIGGRAADYFGGHYAFGAGVLTASCVLLLLPISARVSSSLFIAMRVLQGMIDGLSFPALNTLIAKWYPKEERSKFASFIFSGSRLGIVISMSVSGWLCSTDFLGGWPSVFYAFGSIGILWSLMWFSLMTNDPIKHRRITEAELKYIQSGCPPVKEQLPVPWTSIFCSKLVWVLAAIHVGVNWSTYTIMIELPTYFNDILHIDMKNNGLISSMPFLGAWIFSILFSVFINECVSRGIISFLTVRRVSMFIAGYVVTLGMLAMCFVNCNQYLAFVTIITMVSLSGAVFSGFVCSHADIAPSFAGTLLGLTNTLGSIPGFVAPLMTSAITENNNNIPAWRIVFLTSAVITGTTTTIYLSYITTDVQPWNTPQQKRNRDEVMDETESLQNRR